MPRCRAFRCETNIFIAMNGDDVVPVTLAVEFEVAPPDPDVGIMGCGIDGFTAKVVEVDGDRNPDVITAAQLVFDANEEEYRDEIDEACLESMGNGDDEPTRYRPCRYCRDNIGAACECV